MSPRAACRLESLGFREVYDYMPGKVDWLARGLPTEGEVTAEVRTGHLAGDDVVTCGLHDSAEQVREHIESSPYGFALVVTDRRIVLGRLRLSEIDEGDGRSAEELMEPGPATVRAHSPAEPLVQRLRERDLRTAVVTTPEGELIGVIDREQAEARLR